jgi:hypothetical protein
MNLQIEILGTSVFGGQNTFSASVKAKDKYKLTIVSEELANTVKEFVKQNNLSWQEDYNVLADHGMDTNIFNIHFNDIAKDTIIIIGSVQGMQLQFPVKVSLASSGTVLSENFWNEVPTAPTGGAKSEKKTYQGRSYVVRKGERGGKYIIVKGKKIYC